LTGKPVGEIHRRNVEWSLALATRVEGPGVAKRHYSTDVPQIISAESILWLHCLSSVEQTAPEATHLKQHKGQDWTIYGVV
jgi:hypothetical protein